MTQLQSLLYEGDSKPNLPFPDIEITAGPEGFRPAVLSVTLAAVDLVPWASQNHPNVSGIGAELFLVCRIWREDVTRCYQGSDRS